MSKQMNKIKEAWKDVVGYGGLMFSLIKSIKLNNKNDNSFKLEIQDDLSGCTDLSMKAKEVDEHIEKSIVFEEMGIEVRLNIIDRVRHGTITFAAIKNYGVCVREIAVGGESEFTKSIKIIAPGKEVIFEVNSYYKMKEIAFYINKPDGSILGFISIKELI